MFMAEETEASERMSLWVLYLVNRKAGVLDLLFLVYLINVYQSGQEEISSIHSVNIFSV